MSTISVTSINDGDAVTAASINNQVNTIVNDYNGNITAANLATNAVTSAKITNANITPDKLGTGAAASSTAVSGQTASTTYTPTLNAGPTVAVTVTIGANGLALVCFGSIFSNSTSASAIMHYAVSGATTKVANDALSIQTTLGTNVVGFGSSLLETGLTAGSTTFTLQMRVGGGTGTWSDRWLSVIPL